MKLKMVLQILGLVLIFYGCYFFYQMYEFSKGVVDDDPKRLEKFEIPREVVLSDSTKAIIGSDSLIKQID